MCKYKDLYGFGLWVFDCLDISKPKLEMSDVIPIVEEIGADSYEELAKIIFKNSVINPNNYKKNINVVDKIIEHMISTFDDRDMETFTKKCEMLDFYFDINKN